MTVVLLCLQQIQQHSYYKFKINAMTLFDIWTLVKKIAVGILIFLVPLFIIAAILWFIQNRF